jgi:hypothetical protein
MGRILAVSANTFREVVRQPVYGIILFAAMASVAFSPSFAFFSMMEDVKIVKDIGLATMLMAGLFLGGVSASAVLRRETENRTASTVLSKPVSRGAFVFAKYLGILLALALAEYLVLLILLFSVRMDVPMRASYTMDVPVFLAELCPFLIAVLVGGAANYFRNRPFTSTAVLTSAAVYTVAFLVVCVVGKEWGLTAFGTSIDWQTALAGVLVFLAVTVLASVAMAASTRLPATAAILFTLGVMFAGMLSDYMFGQAVDRYLWRIEPARAAETDDPALLVREPAKPIWPENAVVWARVGYAVLPNLQAFWMADVLGDEKRDIPLRYIGRAAAYAGLYQAAILFIAAMLFQKKEVA